MRLKELRVQDYRSIHDTTAIDIDDLTVLAGRNESGKSNILMALARLKSSDDSMRFDIQKDYPRDKPDPSPVEEGSPNYLDNIPVVSTCWELTEAEMSEIAETWPELTESKLVSISMGYANKRIVEFKDMPKEFDAEEIKPVAYKMFEEAVEIAKGIEGESRIQIEESAESLRRMLLSPVEGTTWAYELETAFEGFQNVMGSVSNSQSLDWSESIEQLSAFIDRIQKRAEANELIIEKMPVFIYLDEYPDLIGEQDIEEFLDRESSLQQTASDINFGKMCKVAELDISKLREFLNNRDIEACSRILRDAEVLLTREIQKLWTDRPLKIHFYAAENKIVTFVSNPDNASDIKINLNARSKGFQWFFSFYVIFAADTKGGSAENAILLFDEPGTHLHAKSQQDLLAHFKSDFKNQIVYSTHSPFMLPTERLGIIKAVTIDDQGTTVVSKDQERDEKTMFIIQAAIGYDLAQSLFVGPNNLIVEGITDFWILSTVSEFLNSKDKNKGLNPDIIITPCSGASTIPLMMSFMASENLNVLALFDNDAAGVQACEQLIENGFLKTENAIFVSKGFASGDEREADIEDLLDPALYEKLVFESHEDVLGNKKIKPKPEIARISTRFKEAFDDAGLVFNKTWPLYLFIEKMGVDPEKIIDKETEVRFERLFKLINKAIKV